MLGAAVSSRDLWGLDKTAKELQRGIVVPSPVDLEGLKRKGIGTHFTEDEDRAYDFADPVHGPWAPGNPNAIGLDPHERDTGGHPHPPYVGLVFSGDGGDDPNHVVPTVGENFHDCEDCGAASGEPCQKDCYGNQHYPGERDLYDEQETTFRPGAPFNVHTIEMSHSDGLDPEPYQDYSDSPQTFHASTDGIRYAHLVEADVADDLMRLHTAAADDYHQIDEWGNAARDGHWDYADPDVDAHMNGNCWDWAIAHQRQNPHLRIGQEWHWQEPDEREHPEDEWMAIHAFTHDDHWAYDVRGAFPLADWRKWKGWDDVTFNHEPYEIGGGRYGKERPLYPPLEELVSRNKPKPPLPVTPEMVKGDDGWHVARLAMAWDEWAPRVQGGCKTCTHKDDGNGSHGEYWIEHEPTGGPLPGDALTGGKMLSNLSFFHDVGRDGVPELYIAGIHTSSGHRRDGIAEALLRRMHQDHPGTRINPGFMTDMGEGLKDGLTQRMPETRDVLARLAAVTQDLVDRLHDEFHDWWDQNKDDLFFPEANPHGRGPVGHWPNIESFLQDRYPAAHKGFENGYENAAKALDLDHSRDMRELRNPLPDDPQEPIWTREDATYETGPKAVEKHGYDPAEIAAGMVLLHNRSHRGRVGLGVEDFDQQRLVNIFTKRQQMQRDYEQRTKTAMPASDAYDPGVRVQNFDPAIPGGPWYHSSDEDFEEGFQLTSPRDRNQYPDGVNPDHPRNDWVWLSDDPEYAQHYGLNLYEVEPQVEGPWPWNGQMEGKRFVAPRARIVRRVPPRTAMPAPLPEGLQFTYHPDDQEPEARAHLNGKEVGYLEWNGSGMEWLPNEVSFISVDPEWRRRGIGTALYDFARQHDPDLHHSDSRTDLGEQWVNHEQSRQAARTAMPWYHNTDAELNTGDELLPAAERGHHSQWADVPTYDPHSVYIYSDDFGDYYDSHGKNQYEVEPLGPVSRDPEFETNKADYMDELDDDDVYSDNDVPGANSHVTPRARVIRKLNTASRTAMPTYYHYTHDPDFKPDLSFHPWDHFEKETEADNDGRHERKNPGLYVHPDPERWKRIDWLDGGRPYKVELDGPDADDEGDDRGHFIPGDRLNQYQVKSVTPNPYSVDEGHQRLAMPAPLPKGTYFRYHPELIWSPGVTAHAPGGKQVGSLEWYDDDHVMVDLGTRRPGEIDRIQVPEDHRGQSIATSMFDFAKQHEPRLHHSDHLTEDGRGWSQYEQSRNARLAAVTQDLVNNLHDEFHQWAGENPHKVEVPYLRPERGVIGDWQNIENFLQDRYPAAYKNHEMGMEEAAHFMDGTPQPDHDDPDDYPDYTDVDTSPYETGSEAIARHGYDPKEIAAGMLLLHNKSHPLRGDMAQEDQDRLNDIFMKRQQMQRDYEQRTAQLALLFTAAPVRPELVDQLYDEFHEWAKANSHKVEDDGYHGPIGHWPSIENFLKDRYPAAHKGLNVGAEEAGDILETQWDHGWKNDEIEGPIVVGNPFTTPVEKLMDGTGDWRRPVTPYETGAAAHQKHGYDPAEIAAGMLLLHNESNEYRQDKGTQKEDRYRLDAIKQNRDEEFRNADVDVLSDIAKKRTKMQRRPTAMGKRGPMPGNLTFKYWPDSYDGPPPPKSVLDFPAVTAHIGDDPEPVGHLSWIDGHPDDYRQEMLDSMGDEGKTLDDIGMSDFGQPIGSHPGDEDYIGWPTTISNVHVHDDWKRRGIADAMFDHVQKNYMPELRHSYDLTSDGHAWAQKEEKRRKRRQNTAMAVLPEGFEGPAEPSYDPGRAHRYDPSHDEAAPADATWYHVTPHKLEPGAVLTPSGGDSLYDEADFYDHNNSGRKRWVWAEHDPEKVEHWMDDIFDTHIRGYTTHPMDWDEEDKLDEEPPLYVYRVQPHNPPQPWDSDAHQGWVMGGATVLGEEMRETGSYFDRVRTKAKPEKSRVARAPWNPAGGPLWRGMRVRWSPEELARLTSMHESGEHEALAHTILDRVQHGSSVGDWHSEREDGGGLGVFWSGSPDVSQGYSQHGAGADPNPPGPFENVVVQTKGYHPDDEWTPYDEDVDHDEEPNDFLNEDRETDLYPGAPLAVTHVHVNAPGEQLSVPLTRPRKMTAQMITALDWHSHQPEQQRVQFKDKLLTDPTFLEPTDSTWYDEDKMWSEDGEDIDADWIAHNIPDYDPTPRVLHFQNPPRQQTWYHVSPHEMQPGDPLVPLKNESYDNRPGGYTKYTPPGGYPQKDEFENPLGLPPYDNSSQAQNVWMAPGLYPHPRDYRRFTDSMKFHDQDSMDPAELESRKRDAFAQGGHNFANWWARRLQVPSINNGQMHIYEVRPTEHPQGWNLSNGHGYAASGARVIRKVPPEEWQNAPSEREVRQGIDEMHGPVPERTRVGSVSDARMRYFLGLDWHSHDPEQQRLQVKDKIPADPSFLEPTDSNFLTPEDYWNEQYGDDEDRFMSDEDYDQILNDPGYNPTPRAHTYVSPPKQQTWYHVSPHEIEPGEHLVPQKNPSYDNHGDYRKYTPPGGGDFFDDDFENPLKLPPYDNHTQGNYVWMSPQLRPDPADYDSMKDKIQYSNNDVTPEEDEARRQNWFWRGNENSAKWWADRLRKPDINNGQMHVYEVRPTEHPKPWNGTTGNGWAAPSARVVRKVPPEEWQTPLNGSELIEQARNQRSRQAMLSDWWF